VCIEQSFIKISAMALKMANVFLLAALALLSGSSNVSSSETKEGKQKITTAETGSWADRDRLLQRLFEKYNKDNYPDECKVDFGLSIIHMDVDELERNLELNVWVKQVWTDDRLMWSPEDFGGHTVIRVPAEKLWLPDIVPYNSLSDPGIKTCSNVNALLYSTGKVLTVTNCHDTFYCNLTLDHYPYGEQSCTLKYGSWTFDGYAMDIQLYANQTTADVSDMWDTTEWQIGSTQAIRREKYYPCCKEPYVSVETVINFNRKGVAGINSCSDR